MRLLAFYLVLLITQGFLAALMAPLPPPDLFLVAVLTLMGRMQPWQLVLVAYGVGLMQDAVGHGVLGMHAFGLAGAVLAASLVRAQLTQSGFFERLLVVGVAIVGKWAMMAVLLLWVAGSSTALAGLVRVVPFDAAFTLLVSLLLLPFADVLLERAKVLQKELL